jgi:hypothetical protein
MFRPGKLVRLNNVAHSCAHWLSEVDKTNPEDSDE